MEKNAYQMQREVPTLYKGRLVEIIPKMVQAGQVPANFAYRMLGVLQGNEEWLENYHDLGDTAVIPESGRFSGKFKVVHNSDRLLRVNKETVLIDGRLPVDYAKVKGRVFSRKNIERDLSRVEAKNSKFYLKLSFGNKPFLGEVVDRIFDAGKEIGYKEMMGIYLPEENQNQALEVALFVDRLENGSQLVGRDYLDLEYGRLVGVAPEALASLEYILKNEKNPKKLWKLLGVNRN